MSEVTENDVVQDVIDYKAKWEESQKAVEALAAKKDELLKETKQAKADRENAKKEAQRIEQDKALKDGEFEKLWKQEQEEKLSYKQQLENDRHERRAEKIENQALKISAELSEGSNVKLLSRFVQDTINKLADEKGSLSDDVLFSIKKEFEQNPDFKALMKQNHSQGSSAPGNTRSAPVADNKTIDRSTFSSWPPAKQMEFVKKGGLLTE